MTRSFRSLAADAENPLTPRPQDTDVVARFVVRQTLLKGHQNTELGRVFKNADAAAQTLIILAALHENVWVLGTVVYQISIRHLVTRSAARSLSVRTSGTQ
jgi:hypothetical protein